MVAPLSALVRLNFTCTTLRGLHIVNGTRFVFQLLSFLEQNYSNIFPIDKLDVAVAEAYRSGDAELFRLAQDALAHRLNFRPSQGGNLYTDANGVHFTVTIAVDLLKASALVVRVSPYLAAAALQVTDKTTSACSRFSSFSVVAPSSNHPVVAGFVDEFEDALAAMEGWVEHKMLESVESFEASIADILYRIIRQCYDVDPANRELDVALIGKHRGWRLPHANSVKRTLDRLRQSPGAHEADQLGAAFVSTTLSRSELLMASTLFTDSEIVRPFRQAPYILSQSYFSLATQLRHAGSPNNDTTSSMRAIYKSESVNVVVIFPTADAELSALIERNMTRVSEIIHANLTHFERALAVFESAVEGNSASTRVGTQRLFKVLDELTAEDAVDKRRWYRRFR